MHSVRCAQLSLFVDSVIFHSLQAVESVKDIRQSKILLEVAVPNNEDFNFVNRIHGIGSVRQV